MVWLEYGIFDVLDVFVAFMGTIPLDTHELYMTLIRYHKFG